MKKYDRPAQNAGCVEQVFTDPSMTELVGAEDTVGYKQFCSSDAVQVILIKSDDGKHIWIPAKSDQLGITRLFCSPRFPAFGFNC